jgi:hypothetical protein
VRRPNEYVSRLVMLIAREIEIIFPAVFLQTFFAVCMIEKKYWTLTVNIYVFVPPFFRGCFRCRAAMDATLDGQTFCCGTCEIDPRTEGVTAKP